VSRPRPVDWATIRNGLKAWFSDASGLDTIWGNQAAPQLPYPYASINIIGPGPTNFGVHAHEGWTEDGELQIIRQGEFVLSCQIHVGPPDNVEFDCDGWAVGQGVVASLDLPDVVQQFREVGLALRSREDPQDITLVIGSEWISRTRFDLRFGYTSVMTTDNTTRLRDVGYFDKIELSSEIDGIKHPGGPLELDDEILDPQNP